MQQQISRRLCRRAQGRLSASLEPTRSKRTAAQRGSLKHPYRVWEGGARAPPARVQHPAACQQKALGIQASPRPPSSLLSSILPALTPPRAPRVLSSPPSARSPALTHPEEVWVPLWDPPLEKVSGTGSVFFSVPLG